MKLDGVLIVGLKCRETKKKRSLGNSRVYRCVAGMVSIWDGAFVLFVIRLAGIKPWPESIPASHRMWIARLGQLTHDSAKIEEFVRNEYYSSSLCVVTLIVVWSSGL